MDGVSESFGVQRWGIYLLGDENYPESIDVRGVSDDFVERYQQFGRSVDPVLNYVIEYHAPAHEELVLPPGGWKQSELYQRCCSEYNQSFKADVYKIRSVCSNGDGCKTKRFILNVNWYNNSTL